MKKIIYVLIVLTLLLSEACPLIYAQQDTDGAVSGTADTNITEDTNTPGDTSDSGGTVSETLSGLSDLDFEDEDGEDGSVINFKEYLSESELSGADGKEITISALALSDYEKSTVDGIEGIKITENGELKFDFSVEKSGEYELLFTYLALESRYSNISFTVNVDGELPYAQLRNVSLSRMFTNETKEFEEDSRGNHISPEQISANVWQKKTPVYDSEGVYSQALSLCLEEGEHTISLSFSRTDLLLSQIILAPKTVTPDYSTYLSQYSSSEAAENGEVKIYEAEKALYKSDGVLSPAYDRNDPATSPSDAVQLKLNTIGGSTWQRTGQWIEWEVEADQDGFYSLSFRTRQNIQYGTTSYRKLTIDGELPFAEAENIGFEYSSNWKTVTLGKDKNEPYKFYLTKGKHYIRLQVVPGPLSSVYSELKEVVTELNTLYRKIIMITGTSPDAYRDYKIDKDIPDLIPSFERIRDILVEQKNIISESGTAADNQGAIQTNITQLNGFIERPSTIPFRLSQMTTNIASLSAWLINLKTQPLEIDTVILSPAAEKVPVVKSNFFSKLWFQIQSVVASFFSDYQMVGAEAVEGEEVIDVWVMLGREQAQVVKNLVDNNFTVETGINCNISLVQQGIIEATFAGRGPDIAMFMTAGSTGITTASTGSAAVTPITPVSLAARGVLVDLTELEGYDGIIQRFADSSVVPFEYEGGVYALPLTQIFPMMFVRNDIFEELGLEVPQTWDDLLKCSATLQRLNLMVGIGSDAGTFATLLYQYGGAFYDENCEKTRFDEAVALDAFQTWTEFFTKYSFPLTYDILTRFRTGEMPLAVTMYSFYSNLEASAPELNGLWSMVPVPGTVKENGEIDRSACGGGTGTGIVILDTGADVNKCWSFLEWFTRDDIQTKYGLSIETLLGTSGRYNTANINAFSNMPWNSEELEQLTAQWEEAVEIPEIPAGYYITRNLNNAFRLVINESANSRQTLNKYNLEMNKEITRKREEFSLSVSK